MNQVDVNPYKTAQFDEADRQRVKVNKDPESGGRHFDGANGGGVFLDRYNACKVIDLKEGAAPTVCDLTVDPGKTRTLNLEDPDGKPLTGVTASGMGARCWTARRRRSRRPPVRSSPSMRSNRVS